jgi:hypothetical protein
VRFVVLSTLAAVLAFYPKTASACSPSAPPPAAACKPTVVVTSLPSSAPAIPLSVYGADPSSYRLLTSSGALVIGTYTKDSWQQLGTPILVFESSPAPGEYQLEYAEGCPGGVPAKSPTVVRAPLTIAAPALAPASVGRFTIENRSVHNGQIQTYSGACYVEMEYVQLDVVFHTSPELDPYRPVSGYAVKIDGRRYRALAPPESGTSPTIPVATLHAACDGDDRQTGGLSLGQHTVSVTWHPAGATADFPEATTSVDLTCDNASADAGASAASADAGASAASADAGAPAPSIAPNESDAGCSTTGRTPLSAALFTLLAFIGVLACRRHAASYQH